MGERLSQIISEKRKAAGIGCVALAKEMQVTHGYISQIENAKGIEPNERFLKRLAPKIKTRATELISKKEICSRCKSILLARKAENEN